MAEEEKKQRVEDPLDPEQYQGLPSEVRRQILDSPRWTEGNPEAGIEGVKGVPIVRKQVQSHLLRTRIEISTEERQKGLEEGMRRDD